MLSSRFWRAKALPVLSAGALAVGVGACGSSSSSSQSGSSGGSTAANGSSTASASGSNGGSKSPYTLHAILSLSGAASFLGIDEKKALVALQDQVDSTGGIDGHPLHFSFGDNQSTASVSASLAAGLRSQPLLIVGSVTTTDKPVDSLASSNGPLVYDLSPGDHPVKGSFVFSSAAATTAQVEAEVNFLKAKGYKRVAAITSSDASGQDGWTNIQKAIGADGGTVKLTDHETFAPTDVSVSSQLSRIQTTHPQALIIWTTGTPLGTVLHGMQQVGMTSMPVLTTNGNASYAEMQHFSSILPSQIYFPGAPFQLLPSQLHGSQKTAVETFVSAMKKQGSPVPDEGEALAWDPGLLLVSALKKLGVGATAAQVHSYIMGQTSFTGVDGSYNFSSKAVAPDNRGLGEQAILITQWSKAKNRWVGVSTAAGKSLLPGA